MATGTPGTGLGKAIPAVNFTFHEDSSGLRFTFGSMPDPVVGIAWG